jgi:hypothetical protein
VPKTQLGQCKVAVSFLALLLAIIFPALLMRPPPWGLRRRRGSRGCMAPQSLVPCLRQE